MTQDPSSITNRTPGFRLEAVGAGAGKRWLQLDDFRGSWLTLLYLPESHLDEIADRIWPFCDRRNDFAHNGCDVLGIARASMWDLECCINLPRETRGGMRDLRICLASDANAEFAHDHAVSDRQMGGVFIVDPWGARVVQLIYRREVEMVPDVVLHLLASAQGTFASTAADPAPRKFSEIFVPGNIVDNYRIESHIADGSFATVFRANDLKLQRLVALKAVKNTSKIPSAALLVEARAIAALSHPNICTVYGAFEVEGIPVFSMELLEGESLESLCTFEKPLTLTQAADIGRQIAAGMAAAHALGIFHSDLKPANVLVAEDGRVKVVDFGLARRDTRIVDPDSTVVVPVLPPGAIIGTPSYMSPEQSFGRPAFASSDIFSFGVVLYEMITGVRPFAGRDTAEVIYRLRNVDASLLASELPKPFSEIVRVALERDPAARAISMTDIESRLAVYLQASQQN